MTAIATTPIEERLDRLTEQVAALTAELEAQRRERERWAELASDATPVARRALERVTTELDELDISGEELVGFLKTFADALPTLEAGLRQLVGLGELAEILSGVSGPALEMAIARLGEFEDKGYVDFAKQGLGVVDRVVTSFSPEDVEALGDNIVLILSTVKEMTQPEVMSMLSRTFHKVQEQEIGEPPSLLHLAKELREPQVRLGLERILTMLRSVGENPPSGA